GTERPPSGGPYRDGSTAKASDKARFSLRRAPVPPKATPRVRGKAGSRSSSCSSADSPPFRPPFAPSGSVPYRRSHPCCDRPDALASSPRLGSQSQARGGDAPRGPRFPRALAQCLRHPLPPPLIVQQTEDRLGHVL